MKKWTQWGNLLAGVLSPWARAESKDPPIPQAPLTLEEFRASRPIDPILYTWLLILAAAVAVGALIIVGQAKRQKQRDAELRLFWRRKIEERADDLTTGSNGWSLDLVMECLDFPEWEDICFELEKMPAGQRSLQKALEIAARDDYQRSP